MDALLIASVILVYFRLCVSLDNSGVYQVWTFAGQYKKLGSSNGFGTYSTLNSPYGITYNSRNGFLYVADSFNHAIRRVSLTGEVTIFAGGNPNGGYSNGVGTRAAFYSPYDLHFNAYDGFIYVADNDNNMIR